MALANLQSEDSYNVLPALLGFRSAAPIREATVFIGGGTSYAIRKGPWLFIDTFTGDGNAEPAWFKDERGYPPDDPAAPGVLYDLDHDPQERTDLYSSNIEKALELKALLATHRQSSRSTPRSLVRLAREPLRLRSLGVCETAEIGADPLNGCPTSVPALMRPLPAARCLTVIAGRLLPVALVPPEPVVLSEASVPPAVRQVGAR